ncbi:MAG TPA: CBS domain-containing protein [Candidatus Desulfobacillus sp.]|nr:CBS domain-containing protein [Candidatus Desulfobacillus sp.]
MIVRNWMQKEPMLVDGDTLLSEAKRVLTEHNLQALPVVENGRLRGMLTRQHCLRASHFVARTQSTYEYSFYANRLKVKDIMVRNPATLDVGDTMEECLRRGQELGVGQFPVMDGGKVVGVISSKEIFSLAARFLGAWEKRCGVMLGPLEIKPGTVRRIADVVTEAGGDVLAIYPIARGENGADGRPQEHNVIVRFNSAGMQKVVAALEGAGFAVVESVDAGC